MKLPKTLFARTVTVIATFSFAFLLFALSAISYFILVPIGKQSADDLAALMVFSAQTLTETSADKKPQFEQQLLNKYQLRVTKDQELEILSFKPLPYYYFLELSLQSRTEKPVQLKISKNDKGSKWYWADLNINNKTITIGFPESHINAQPPVVLILLLVVGGLAIFVTATALVRHLTIPLESLSQSALRIGEGEEPELIPESGPYELVTLAKSFNKMSSQVKELLSNRTTLLAGISHDLRTPLARIQLAVEMLPDDADPEIVDGIRGDVDQMNCLIGQFLELSKVLEKGERHTIHIPEVLEELVNCSRRGGAIVNWQTGEACSVISNPLSLRRIIINLMENAVRYSNGKPIDVEYHCGKDVVIKIKDRGPGIPDGEKEAIFRPFYRLDQSRNIETGGTGLGLSIARQLAEINKIKIHLHDRKEGGTVAEIIIPAN